MNQLPKPNPQDLVARQQEIRKMQQNKQDSIKRASTIRMATDIVVALLPNEDVLKANIGSEEIKEGISYWRNYLRQEWDK